MKVVRGEFNNLHSELLKTQDLLVKMEQHLGEQEVAMALMREEVRMGTDTWSSTNHTRR